MKEIERFLRRFHLSKNIDEVFTEGCCYWFAIILAIRFVEKSPEIVYDEVINHFGCRIHGHVYDITGDVTEKYHWVQWLDMTDTALVERIRNQCINF